MAGRKENLKSLFTNTRTRVIIIFTTLLLVAAVIIGVTRFTSSTNVGPLATANLTNAPAGIQSIPGALDPTAQYARLQEMQNVNQAQVALQTGGSAIPTIIRTQTLGSGVQAVGPQQGQGNVGFSTLIREQQGGPQQSLWLQDLRNSNCSKSTVEKVLSEGAGLSDLKGACTCVQLKDNGYQITDLQQICSCPELRSAGFNSRQLKDAGFSAERLRVCGFDACELRNAGFTAQQMKDGGFSDGELKGAGFPDNDIERAGGLPDGITDADVRNAGCQVAALEKLRAAGVTAAAIRRISGCSAEQLKAAGFTAGDLKNAGFSAADLRKAGFTPDQLKQAGFGARDLLNAGYTPAELAAAGYTPAQLAAAEAELPPGITPDDIKNAGCSVEALEKERLAGVSAKLIHQYAGCSAAQLKAAGFTDGDLANAGFTPQQISAANPPDDNAIRAAGCDPNKLKVLFNEGVSAKRIRDLNGCSAQALKAAGYDAKALTDAGFTPQDLLAAGFTPAEIRKAAADSDDAIRAAGCDPEKLKALFAQGVSARKIHELNGCSAQALKDAGYDAKALSDAGFSPQDLLGAGFTPDQLRAAGINPAAVIAAGRTADCSVASLQAARAAGVSAATIRQTLGCSAAALKAAGYTAADLKNAGFTPGELKAAGFSPAELKAAGFTPRELRAAGLTAQQLKDAGYNAGQLKDAGFSANDLKNSGFTPAQLKAAGYNTKELKDAGVSPQELLNAGFEPTDLKNAGFSVAQLKNAGLSNAQLRDAGFDVASLPDEVQTTIPSNLQAVPGQPFAGMNNAATTEAANTQQLQEILKRQNQQLADQRYQQQIQQRTAEMLGTAQQSLQAWQKVAAQSYNSGNEDVSDQTDQGGGLLATGNSSQVPPVQSTDASAAVPAQKALIKTGEIMFAVLDTSVNSDEPGPILATIVSGRFKGAKLIGSFNLPTNSDKMVISFNTMSVPGAAKTTPISAYAIDPNTARTALSSRTDHHYLLRYGSLFASSFLEGFGNAFQSADTTVTIGGTGGGDNITIQNGIGRSALENAVIGLATLGKTWGQVAQQQFNRPTTVDVYSGTGLGVLFTQDLTSL